MKKLFGLILCLAMLPIPALAQTQFTQSIAATIDVPFTLLATAQATTAGIATNFTFFLAKASSTSSTTATVFIPTASGGANDLVYRGAVGNLELTAAQLDTAGNTTLCWSYADGTIVYDCRYFNVGPTAVELSAALANLQTFPRAVAYPNFAVTFFNTNGTRKTDLTAAAISCNVFLDGAAANAVDDTSETELSDADAPGVWLFDLTAAETTGDSGVVFCKTTGGLYAQANFQTQH